MFRTVTALRLALAGGALLALSLGGRAQPFPPGKAVPTPLIVALVPYVGDEGVQKELKLTDEQKKKLIAARQKMWDDAWNTAPKDVDTEARYKAVETAFKDTLSAEQHKRASQLAAQFLWINLRGGGGFGPVGATPLAPSDPRRVPAQLLAQYPAVADALKLGETQKKLAEPTATGRGRAGTTVYLTTEQTATAKNWLGELYKGSPRPEYDPRNTFGRFGGGFGGPGRGFGLPAPLQYTNAPDVQKELGLTEEQLRALVDLRLKWGQPDNDYFALSPAARKKVDDERTAELEKALEKALSAEQRKRLKEIARQSGPGSDVVFIPDSEVGKELTVTDAQRKKYEAVRAAHADAVVKAVLSDDEPEKVRAAVAAATKERDAAVEAILTAEQAAKKKELFGEPFKGNVFGPGGPGLNATSRKFTFGRYSGQLTTLATYKGVQEELKLDKDQIKKLGELQAEFITKFPFQDTIRALQDEKNADKHFADRHALIEKAITDVLTKEQQARFRELQLQQLEAPPQSPGSLGGFGRINNTAASYPGVAEVIKLTDEQKKKLIDGAKPADVLNADQKKSIEGMLGKKADLAAVFAPPGFPGPGPGGGNPLPALRPEQYLLLNTAVWDALKLDRDQITKLVPAANQYTLANPRRGLGGGGGFPGGPGGGPPLVDPKEVKAAIEAFEKTADELLTAEQKKRLDQLSVQQALAVGLDEALLTNRSPRVRVVALTDEQRKSISALGLKFSALATELDRVDIPPDKEFDARLQLRDRLDAAVLMVLTADQKAKLKELTGEPFTGFPKQPLFRGFGGGPGGFGGFGGPFGP